MLIFLTPLANNYFLEIINYYCMSFCFLNKYINVFCFKLWCLIIYTGKYFFFFFFGSIIGMFPHEAPFLGYLPEDLYSVGCIASTDLETFTETKLTDMLYLWNLQQESELNLLCETWQACSYAQCLEKDYISECDQIDLETRLVNPIHRQIALWVPLFHKCNCKSVTFVWTFSPHVYTG